MTRRSLLFWIRCAATVALITMAALKLAYPWTASIGLPMPAYYSAALIEAVGSWLIWTRYCRAAAFGLILLFLMAGLDGILRPTRQCGCLGAISLSSSDRLLLSSMMGLMSALLLCLASPRPTSDEVVSSGPP